MGVVSAAIIAGGAIASAAMASDASRKAANAMKDASGKATDAQLQMYFDAAERNAPFEAMRNRILPGYEKTITEGPGEFKPEEQPGYKFGYKEFIEKPLLQQASSATKLRSGNVLRALSDRASDYASLSYDSWLNRWLTKLQPQQSALQLAQTGGNAVSNMGIQTGQGIGQNILAGGMAQSQNQINQGNIGSNLLMSGARNYLDYQTANKIGGGNLFSTTLRDPGTPPQGVYEGWTIGGGE